MESHFLLWSSGPDKPGIVAAVTKALFTEGTNLEDSSMMRLGAEFGIFLIFSSKRTTSADRLLNQLQPLARRHKLTVGVKKLTRREASFRASTSPSHIVSVYGPDRPGIVSRITNALARRRFNITDLSTHRTRGLKAGYILFIEGDAPSERALTQIRRDLTAIQRALKARVDIRPISAERL